MGHKTTVICAWYSDDTPYFDDAQFLIGCWKLGKWCIACLVGMMSHVLCHNRSADGVESKSWLVIRFSFQRLLHPLAFSPRCLSVFLAGTTMQGFSSWDEASSSMYLEDVSSTDLSYLDEEAAYISCMSWSGFTTLLHKGVAAAKVEAMQMWWWRGGAHGWRQRLWRAGQGCMCDIFVAMTLLGRQPESSSVHAIAVSHFFIKMCQLITWYFSWMHGWFCFTTARNPCTVVPARDTLDHLELNAWRTEMSLTWRKDHLPWLARHSTSCHYGLEHVTLFLLGMGCLIFLIFNKIKSRVSSLSDVSFKYQKE